MRNENPATLRKRSKGGFERLRVYHLAESLSDEVWAIVVGWERLAKETVGRQLVRAADSIGANIAEGTGRRSFQDNRRFVRTARGSLFETRHWLRRAHQRRLLSAEAVEKLKPLMDELGPRLNAYLHSIGPVRKAEINSANAQTLPANDKGQGTKDQ